MRVMNTDAVSYQSKTPEQCLETAKSEKKRKCLNNCLNKRRKSTPFAASVDVLLRSEADATLKRIFSCLAQKYQEPYSRTCGYVKSRVAINLARATHCCIRGGRVPASCFSVTPPLPVRRESCPVLIHLPPSIFPLLIQRGNTKMQGSGDRSCNPPPVLPGHGPVPLGGNPPPPPGDLHRQ